MEMNNTPEKGDGNFRGKITYAEAEKLIRNCSTEVKVKFMHLKKIKGVM